jgi:eukaryotic-like serine/threonine-protein kinase
MRRSPGADAVRICPECKGRTEERVCPSCRITTVDEAVLSGQDLVGRVFAERYEVQDILGRGGMGAVYRARHVAMDSTVALKVLRRETSGDLDSIERFYREARAASRLHHPNTIRVFDFGQSDDGQLFLAMEFLDGHTLRAELRRMGRLDESRVLRIGEQVAMSLGEAHHAGIIHRDVKPENIFLLQLLGVPDFVKVLDFGVARNVGADSMTRTGLAIGTPAYMSPEQARGERVDGRSDLYSLGVMMFEMAAGIPPFESSTPMHLMMKHLNDVPPRLSEVCGGDVSPAFDALVMSLLSKSADDRPRDASDLLDRISAAKGARAAGAGVVTAFLQAPREAQTPTRNGSAAFLDAPKAPTPTTPMAVFSTGGELRGPTARAPEPARTPTPPRSPMVSSAPSEILAGAGRGHAGRNAAIVVLVSILAAAAAGGAWWWTSRSGDEGATVATGEVPAAPASPSPAAAVPVASPSVPAPAPSPAPAAPPPVAGVPPAPAPEAAAPRRLPVSVVLDGTPAGARVVDRDGGAPLGTLPAPLEVAPDRVLKVRVQAPGYRPQDLDIGWEEARVNPERMVRLQKRASPGPRPAADDGWDL